MSANKAADPDESPKGSSPAAQAAFYAGRANSYAESAATSNQFAQDLYPQGVAEAAIAGPSYGRTAKQIETALTLARTGVDDDAAGGKAAKVAAFDADTGASDAAAAQEDGDYELAAAEADAAEGAMIAAKTAATSADLGAGKVLYALHSLIPNSPVQLG